MAKLAREGRLRERRLNKEAKREARKQAPTDHLGPVDSEPTDPREKEVALLRLRDAPDQELAVFERTLQDDALGAGASEGEMRTAQRDHPGHGA